MNVARLMRDLGKLVEAEHLIIDVIDIMLVPQVDKPATAGLGLS